jgi:hypothetical protein
MEYDNLSINSNLLEYAAENNNFSSQFNDIKYHNYNIGNIKNNQAQINYNLLNNYNSNINSNLSKNNYIFNNQR